MNPPDTLEDDPPEDWNIAPNMDDLQALEEAGRHLRESLPSTSEIDIDKSPPTLSIRSMQLQDGAEGVYCQPYPNPAGTSYGTGQTRFDILHEEQRAGRMAQMGPFADIEEWELAKWLVSCGASQSEIDRFLKLNIVGPLYFFPVLGAYTSFNRPATGWARHLRTNEFCSKKLMHCRKGHSGSAHHLLSRVTSWTTMVNRYPSS